MPKGPQAAPAPTPTTFAPFWQSADGGALARLYLGNVTDVLGKLPERSVQCCVTSPPYWGLRDYGVEGQLGAEPSPDCRTWGQAQCGACFVCNMVAVFRGVRRVLRDDGTCWLNLGDSYSGGKTGRGDSGNSIQRADGTEGEVTAKFKVVGGQGRSATEGIPSGNLVGIPWRVALALQADGWVLRQDIIWCLSGGTWLYVRGAKGEVPIQIGDLYDYENLTDIEVWTGEKWTKILGLSKSEREGDEVEMVLRSGERIACTPNHKFPTKDRGLVEAGELTVGDKLVRCRLPEPDHPKKPTHITNDAAWLAGLYLAEGSGVDDGKISIAGHRKELARYNRVRKIVKEYGGSCTLRLHGNNSDISVYGKIVCAVIKELVSGKDAKTKCLSPNVWKYGNDFLEAFMDGYLSGDGGELDGAPGGKAAGNWSIGFCRNYNLERDIRVACARLGWALILRPGTTKFDGREFPTFWGEIRKTRSGHFNEKDRDEVVEIRKSRCRAVFDLGIADEPHLFAMASGILTHNSKPAPMPESVRNRCTKAHEYVFLLTKRMGYYCDMEAIKEKSKYADDSRAGQGRLTYDGKRQGAPGTGNEAFVTITETSNKRSVWSVSSQGYPGAHFAVFPAKLIQPMILAGTSEAGACSGCGAPWERVVEETPLTRDRPNDYVKRSPEMEGIGNHCSNSVAGVEVKTIGWAPSCACVGADGEPLEVVPCVVLDPFVGSGTTVAEAVKLDRAGVGIDLNAKYLRENAVPRVKGALLSRPETAWLAGT